MSNKNLLYMKQAFKEAKKAFNKNEVPIGAVIVKDNKIIGRGHNLKESNRDATEHAEIIAIKNASKSLGTWRLTGCDMYVTIEPCVMCSGAIYQSRIKKVYIGSPDNKAGGVLSVYKILSDKRLNHQPEVNVGLMRKECSTLVKKFFNKLRQ
ncbi:MAG: nucleoside deaminase [Bacillota bacterium]